MPRSVSFFPNFPVAFDYQEDTTFFCEQEPFCQIAAMADNLSFAWRASECGNNLITNGDFNTGLTGWSGANWSAVGFKAEHTPGSADPLVQTGIITTIGLYRIVLNQTRNAAGDTLVGGVSIKVGGSFTPTFSLEGTITMYLSIASLSAGNVEITPSSSSYNGAIESIEVYQVNTNYLVGIYDMDGNLVTTSTNTEQFQDIFYFERSWKSLGIPAGCYQIKVLDACTVGGSFSNVVVNGTFTGTDAPWQYTNGGAGWSYDAGNNRVCRVFAVASAIEQAIAFVTGIEYSYSFTISNYSAGFITPIFAGVSLAPVSADGTYTGTFTAAGGTVARFQSNSNGTFCLDNVTIAPVINSSIQPAGTAACYKLADEYPNTKLLTWYNDDDGFGFPYAGKTPPLKHYLRVQATKHQPRYPEEGETIRYSNGLKKKMTSHIEKIYTLNILQLPQYLHDAIGIMRGHDHVFIDGQEIYCLVGEYTPDWVFGHNLANGSLEIQNIVQDNDNFNCS